NDASFSYEDNVQNIGEREVRLRNFTGVREWKVLVPLEELIKSKSWSSMELNREWKVRVQIASRDQPLPFPFDVAPTFGIHIGISVGNESFAQSPDHKNTIFFTVCKYLSAIFGYPHCDHERSAQQTFVIDLAESISLPGGNFYFYSNFPSHYEIPAQTSVIGEMIHDQEYNMPSVLDLELKFDEKANEFLAEVRLVWQCESVNIDVVKKSEEEKIELGIFGDLLDPETFIGVRIILGKNKNEPDIYQLYDLYSDDHIKVWGETDLENPVGTSSLKWGSIILAREFIFGGKEGDTYGFNLPLRMRYYPAVPENIQKTHETISASWPVVLYACDGLGVGEPAPLFAPVPLPHSLLFPSTTKLQYILPKDNSRNSWPREMMRVPVGQSNHLKIVEGWTIFITMMGIVWVLFLIKRKRATMYNTKKHE
ncbi:17444_t:CDS:2, partial [Acaulospora morrowiae]